MGLDGVRQATRRDRRLQFTALLHHITPSLLTESDYAPQRNTAAGVDGNDMARIRTRALLERFPVLHREIHTRAYRAQLAAGMYPQSRRAVATAGHRLD